MRALGLAGDQLTLRADSPAVEAAALLSRIETSAAIVVDRDGTFLDVISDEDLLRRLLPTYVDEADVLARVLEEASAEGFWRRLEELTVADLLPPEREEEPSVEADATLVEVASVMVRAGVRLVAVLDGGRVVGGISMEHLLSHLVPRR